MIVLFIVLIVIIGLAIWQKENIKALYIGMTSTKEELEKKREENDKIVSDALEQYPEVNVRDLTEEEKKLLEEGKITLEELLLILQGKLDLEDLLAEKNKESEETEPPATDSPPPSEEAPPTSDDTPEPTAPDEPKPETKPDDKPQTKPNDKTETKPSTDPVTEAPSDTKTDEPVLSVDEQISALVARMYVLKAEFTSALKNLENTTLKDYAAMSKEEKTEEVKSNMMTKVLGIVAGMEKDCDTKVNGVLAELTTLLKANGRSLDLVDSIRAAYNNEKTITKAEYVNKYFK